MPATAITPNQRSHIRESFVQTMTASASVSTPSTPAITRCVCSKNAPPASCRIDGNHVPNDFGQSGTDSAAFLDVTSAPNTNSSTVHSATKTANRCTTRLKVVVIEANATRNYTSAPTDLLAAQPTAWSRSASGVTPA